MQYFAIGTKTRTEHKITVPYQVRKLLSTYIHALTYTHLFDVWTQSDYD